jgi:hypothetical protein
METELVQTLTNTFEAHAQQAEGGVEYWLARDIQFLLGYAKWDNFLNVVSYAKTACEVSGHKASNHFADVGKMVGLGSGISSEHITNNQAVRKTLLERGIRPESLPAVEDVKKVERRLATEEKKSLKNPSELRGDE